MKIAITLLALVALGYSAPQPRKLFHEHYEDFLEVIMNESSTQISQLVTQYIEFEEFLKSLDYLESSDFKNLVYEMEDIPEFKTVIQYLEKHDIDILYFVESINSFVGSIQRKLTRQSISGRDMTSYVQDCIATFPKEKLTALLEEKKAEDATFKLALESFELEEWDQLYSSLWKNEVFLAEVETLKDNGIDVDIILQEAKAVMGIFD